MERANFSGSEVTAGATRLLAIVFAPGFTKSTLICVHARAETPLTSTVMHIHQPLSMLTSLVEGGAHLDYCNSVGLTPMHKAAVIGRREPVKV